MRKAQTRSKNPLKALRNREDVKAEYSEVRSNVADKEMTRIKREQSECFRLLRTDVAYAGNSEKQCSHTETLREAQMSSPGNVCGPCSLRKNAE